MTRKTDWKGWLKPNYIEPELLERIRSYNERYKYYHTYLGFHEHTEAHRLARIDVPLTEEEFDIKRRLIEKAVLGVSPN